MDKLQKYILDAINKKNNNTEPFEFLLEYDDVYIFMSIAITNINNDNGVHNIDIYVRINEEIEYMGDTLDGHGNVVYGNNMMMHDFQLYSSANDNRISFYKYCCRNGIFFDTHDYNIMPSEVCL